MGQQTIGLIILKRAASEIEKIPDGEYSARAG